VTASAVLEGGPESRVERAYPCLDGARALAATAVVVTHVSFWTGDQTPSLLGRVFGRLDVGVAIFFVLSGFLLSRPLFRAAADRRPGPRTAAYLWRRALRILPTYWLTVAGALLLPGNEGAGPGVWLRHLTLAQIYGPVWFGDGLSHTWSLCTEVAFYLVLPAAAGGLLRLSRRRPERPARLLAALAVVAVLAQVWLTWGWTVQPFRLPLDLWLPAFAGWFAAGMALAALSVSDPAWRPVRVVSELGSSLPTCWAAAGVLFWIATSTVAGPLGLTAPTPGQAIVRNLLYLLVGGLLVLPLVFGSPRQGWTRRFLASPPVVFVGEISYGLFLIHMLVLVGGYAALGLRPFTGNVVLVLLGTWLLSVGLAALVYVTVERPLSRWRGLVPDRRPQVGSTEAATAETAASTST
jgi:peptidoglycan/LPS O-acetylase OafA/YrhL